MRRSIGLAGLLLVALSQPAAAQTNDMCGLLARNPTWGETLRAVQERYGVTPGAVLAVIDQESRFDADARGAGAAGPNPTRNFGYTQANLRTWNWFVQDSGYQGQRSRTDFAASAHFVGWHFANKQPLIGHPVSDVYQHYLVYKQGLGGYRRGASAASRAIARRIASRAEAHDRELSGCGF